jgi:hypothetical protein
MNWRMQAIAGARKSARIALRKRTSTCGFKPMTRTVKLLVLAFALLQLPSSAAEAKFFRYNRPKDQQQYHNDLERADSFSVECENQTTGVVDRGKRRC